MQVVIALGQRGVRGCDDREEERRGFEGAGGVARYAEETVLEDAIPYSKLQENPVSNFEPLYHLDNLGASGEMERSLHAKHKGNS